MPSSHVRFALALALPLGAAAAALAAGVPPQTDLTRDQIRQSVVSSMDPKADPCQDFYRYACGGWLDTTTHPRRPGALGAQLLDHHRAQPRGRAGDPRGGRRRPRRATRTGRRSATSTPPAWTRRRSRRPAPAARAGLRRDREGDRRRDAAARRRPAPPPRRRRRCSASAPLADFKNPTVNIGFLVRRAGSACPTATTTSPRTPKKKELLAAVRAITSPACWRSPARPPRRGRRRRGEDRRLRDRAREGLAAARRDARTSRSSTTGSTAPASRSSPRRCPGRRTSRRPASRTSATSTSPCPSSSQALDKLARRDPGRDAPRLPALARGQRGGRPACRRPSSTPTSSSTARRSPASRRSSRAGSAAWRPPSTALGESIGKIYVDARVRRRQQGDRARDDPGHRARLRGEPAEPDLDGRRHPRTRGREGAQDRQQDRLPGRLARLLGARGRRAASYFGNVAAGVALRVRPPADEDRQAGRPQRVADDAADGQRLLQPAAATRSSSRPASCSRPSSTRTSRPRSTTARSARSWATSSPTASTTRAASSTATACCASGGSPRSRPSSRQQAQCVDDQYGTLRGRARASRSTAS